MLIDGIWVRKTTVNVSCSANGAYTSAETVNFVSWRLGCEIEMKQNTYVFVGSETIFSNFLQSHLTCGTGFTGHIDWNFLIPIVDDAS